MGSGRPSGGDAEPDDRDGAFDHGSDEEVDEAEEESFPASDPPQTWAGEPTGER